MTVEVTTPPIMGVAMRFITSAPVPWLQRMGSRPAMITHAVMTLGRRRCQRLVEPTEALELRLGAPASPIRQIAGLAPPTSFAVVAGL